jgi:hypothetical protein
MQKIINVKAQKYKKKFHFTFISTDGKFEQNRSKSFNGFDRCWVSIILMVMMDNVH